ncbi:hypothetical protein StoSoilA2_02120 [Arthrobacter sp. StoSoilA2]|nr:hypothetical protein StoSoilA2_02120 [Arthrobacter sp. StoSoilA2]BCW51863.1 hypothetical protein StoSoilB13_42050 [Arthrobacter sp. StoSoilB13]
MRIGFLGSGSTKRNCLGLEPGALGDDGKTSNSREEFSPGQNFGDTAVHPGCYLGGGRPSTCPCAGDNAVNATYASNILDA